MAPKSADKMISLLYKDFLDGQNEVVQAINNHSSILQAFLGSFSMSMATMRASLLKTRESLKAITSANETDLLEQYPVLLELMSKEPHEIISGMSLSAVGGLPMIVAAPEKKMRKKREQKPKDPNAPKRPNTAFFLFLENTRPEVRKALGENAKPGDVAKEQRNRWTALPESEKEIYKAQYQEALKEYQGEVADYKAKGGHVEDDYIKPIEDDGEAALDAEGSSEVSESSEESEDEEEEANPQPPPPAKKGKKTTATIAAAKDDISSKIDPRLTATELPKPAATPAKSPEKEKKPRGKAAQLAAAAATAAQAAEEAAAAAAAAAEEPEKPKSGRKKKGAAAAAAPASTPAAAPASTPAVAAASEVNGTDSKTKKRMSTGIDLEERKKKRRETLGDDY